MNFEVIGRPAHGSNALLVVPKIDKQELWSCMVKPGSAMVAYIMQSNEKESRTLITYYEGNIFNSSNLVTFHDKAICAYGRMTAKYPTVAMAADTTDSLEIVGLISPSIFELNATDAFKSWVSEKKLNDYLNQ